MFERRGLFRCITAILMLSFIAACAGSSKKESSGEYFDDTAITTKVKAKILQDPKLKVLQINVETFKGIVQLSGFVDSSEAANRAVEVARSVEGVERVENKMTVKN